MQLWQAATGIRMCQRCPVASYPLLLSDSGSWEWWVGTGVGIGGSLDNRAHWLPLTNTAHSKPVRTLLVEVTSSHVIFETAFHLPSLPQGLFSRSLPFLQKVTGTLIRRPCDVWSWPPGPRLAAKEDSGRGGEDGGTLPARLLRKMALVHLWNVITVWYGLKATQIEECPITALST